MMDSLLSNIKTCFFCRSNYHKTIPSRLISWPPRSKTIHFTDFLCKNLCNSCPSKAVNFLPFPTPNLEESCATLDCSHLLLHLLYLGFHPPNVKFEDRSGRTACFAPGKKRRKKKNNPCFPLGNSLDL